MTNFWTCGDCGRQYRKGVKFCKFPEEDRANVTAIAERYKAEQKKKEQIVIKVTWITEGENK